jgi:hypothetical protein
MVRRKLTYQTVMTRATRVGSGFVSTCFASASFGLNGLLTRGEAYSAAEEQGASMAAMVNKFADGEEEANVSDGDDSSFEEVLTNLNGERELTTRVGSGFASTCFVSTCFASTCFASASFGPRSPFRFVRLCHLLTILVLYCPFNH